MAENSQSGSAQSEPGLAVELLPNLSEQRFESPSALQRLAYLLLNPGKNYLIPATWLRMFIKGTTSQLIEESLERPGGWRSMELVYRNPTPIDWIDRQALRDNPIPMAARNRRKMITARLMQLIKTHAAVGHVNLLGIGSGPGWHIQTAIADSGVAASQTTAYLVDLADDAFEHGRQIAVRLRISDSIHFIQGDARQIRDKLPEVQFQIAKLVGIVEYLQDDEFVSLLEAIRGVMAPDGHLVTHGLVDKYGTGPFLARVFNLRHHERDAGKMTELLRRGGFTVSECEYEPCGIHPILTAVRSE